MSLKLSLSHFLLPVTYQSLNAAGVTVVFGAIGVPLGYIIYQIYFFVKWKWPSKKCFDAIQDISELQRLKRMKPNKAWRHIEYYFDRLMSLDVNNSKIREEDLVRRHNSYASRTSRTHGLGASAWAILLGMTFFYLLHWPEWKGAFWTSIAWVIVAFVLRINYSYQNENTYKMLNAMMKDILETRCIER